MYKLTKLYAFACNLPQIVFNKALKQISKKKKSLFIFTYHSATLKPKMKTNSESVTKYN